MTALLAKITIFVVISIAQLAAATQALAIALTCAGVSVFAGAVAFLVFGG